MEEQLKLFSVFDFDLMWCERYLIAYIEILTPVENKEEDLWVKLKSREFSEAHNFIDIIARSLATSIIISYSRPWSKNISGGEVSAILDRKIFKDMNSFSKREEPEERLPAFRKDIHDRILRYRSKIVAHSDQASWSFKLNRGEAFSETEIKDPFKYIKCEEARLLIDNTRALRSQMANYRRELRSSTHNFTS